MSHGGRDERIEDDSEPFDVFEDERFEKTRRPEGWKREWDTSLPDWSEVFDSDLIKGDRTAHLARGHSRKHPDPTHRRRNRDGWGSF